MNDRPTRLSRVRRWCTRLVRDTRGATMVEYGLIIAMIVIVMVVSLVAVGQVTTGMWNNVSAKVQQAH